MQEQTIQTGESPVLTIRNVEGDLSMHGWDAHEIQVRSDGDTVLDTVENGFVVECQGDCTLYAPMKTIVILKTLRGDGQIVDLTGPATIGRVGGDLLLRKTGPATTGSVGGDLAARHVSGDIQIEQVGGDFVAEDVRGSVTASVGGDLSLSSIDGPVQIQTGGDAAVHLAVVAGYEQTIRAGGDVACRIPVDASVQVNLTCADRIAVRGLPVTQTKTSGTWEFVLGEGESTLNLLAGGAIVLSGESENRYHTGLESGSFSAEVDIELGREIAQRASEAAQQIADQFETRMDALGRQLDEKLSHIGDGEEIAAHVQQHIQAAMRKVDHKLSEAVRKSERRVREAEHRAQRAEDRKRRHDSRRKDMKPMRPPKPPREPVTNDERMTILRMVEEGKISVEQAEQLLAALNG